MKSKFGKMCQNENKGIKVCLNQTRWGRNEAKRVQNGG